MSLQDLRTTARTLFDTGVRAADPANAVAEALSRRPLPDLAKGRHILIAVGKAACAMIEAAQAHVLTGSTVTALAVTNYENQKEISGCTVLGAAHPSPDQNGLDAGLRVIAELQAAGAQDHVLFLISGGGSALLPAPAQGISLAEKIAVNDLLLANGFDIHQTNLVRQQLSRLKGGGMAELAAPAPHRSLLVSDVVGDDPRVIASGPTIGPLGTARDAMALLKSRGLWDALPDSVRQTLENRQNTEPSPAPDADYEIICSNRRSLEAMAEATDWNVQIVSDHLAGDVAQAAEEIAEHLRNTLQKPRQILLWGGETTVQIKGSGRGGRNQELALRLAMLAQDLPGDWVILTGGTDGRDGPTDAAGGLVDPGTVQRIIEAGGTPQHFLDTNDSYHALASASDLLVTGATGTNVADLLIFMRA